MITLPSFTARDVRLELLDAGAFPLVRLYKHARAGAAGGEWEPSPPAYRKLRVDPPPGHESEFAVLYTSDTLPCVAAECRVLQYNPQEDSFQVARALLREYRVARYTFDGPGLFVNIDAAEAEALGLQPRALGPGVSLRKPYERYQAVALALFHRFGELAHGVSWQSMHRNQLGRVYAIWHHRKAHLQLVHDVAGSGATLGDDLAWKAFEAENPGLPDVEKPGI